MKIVEALKELDNLTVDYGNRSEAEINRLDRALDMALKASRETGRRDEK